MIDTGLEGKTAIVTGANHGIGAAAAIAPAKEGARVLIAYLRQPPELYGETKENAAQATTPGRAFYCRKIGKSAERVVEEIESHGGQCMEWEADLAAPGSVPMLFDKAEEQWGAVDIIVNNAAFDMPDTFLPQSILDKNPVFAGRRANRLDAAGTGKRTRSRIPAAPGRATGGHRESSRLFRIGTGRLDYGAGASSRRRKSHVTDGGILG